MLGTIMTLSGVLNYGFKICITVDLWWLILHVKFDKLEYTAIWTNMGVSEGISEINIWSIVYTVL